MILGHPYTDSSAIAAASSRNLRQNSHGITGHLFFFIGTSAVLAISVQLREADAQTSNGFMQPAPEAAFALVLGGAFPWLSQIVLFINPPLGQPA
jgi:hypothetical protein